MAGYFEGYLNCVKMCLTNQGILFINELSNNKYRKIMSMESEAKLVAFVGNGLFNSPPLTISEYDLFLKFRTSPKRAGLLDALKKSLENIRRHVDIDCMMLGGSFLSAKNRNPKDIDAILFYRKKQGNENDIGNALSVLIKDSKHDNVDIRFVPTDSQKWIFVKMTAYFTILYKSQRGSKEIKDSGIIIVVPDEFL